MSCTSVIPSKTVTGQWTLSELAKQVGGRAKGNAEKSVTHVDELRHASTDAICHCSSTGQKKFLKETSAGIVILPEGFGQDYGGDCIIAINPRLAFAKVVDLLHPPSADCEPKIDDSASIHLSAVIGESVTIEANVVIGENVRIEKSVNIGAGTVIGDNVSIGEGTTIDSNVSVYSNCVIGRDCHISAGVVLGASGFSYESDGNEWSAIRNIGNVIIGDEVDIGACTTIDRGSIRSTVIGNGVKIDNNVQIGHNVEIGAHSLIVANVGIAGSAKIGKRCILGGQVAVNSHIEMVDDVTIQACSMVSKSILTSGTYSGSIPAREVSTWRRTLAHLYKLNKMNSSST